MSPKNAKQIYDIKPIKKKHRNKNLKNNDNIKKTPYNRLLTGRTSGGYQSII
jgi:predicted GTPase